MKNRVKLVGDNIYIDASYRRTILDKWVWYDTGDKKYCKWLNYGIKNGYEFTNLDLLYWSSKNRAI